MFWTSIRANSWIFRLDISPKTEYNNIMKIELKVVLDTDEPNDKALMERLMELLEELKEMLEDANS